MKDRSCKNNPIDRQLAYTKRHDKRLKNKKIIYKSI